MTCKTRFEFKVLDSSEFQGRTWRLRRESPQIKLHRPDLCLVCLPSLPITISIAHKKRPYSHLCTFPTEHSSSVYIHNKSQSFTSHQAQGCTQQRHTLRTGGQMKRPEWVLDVQNAGFPMSGVNLGGVWASLGLGTLIPQIACSIKLSKMGF